MTSLSVIRSREVSAIQRLLCTVNYREWFGTAASCLHSESFRNRGSPLSEVPLYLIHNLASLVTRQREVGKKRPGIYCTHMSTFRGIYNKIVWIMLMNTWSCRSTDCGWNVKWMGGQSSTQDLPSQNKSCTITETFKIILLYPFGNQAGTFTNQCNSFIPSSYVSRILLALTKVKEPPNVSLLPSYASEWWSFCSVTFRRVGNTLSSRFWLYCLVYVNDTV